MPSSILLYGHGSRDIHWRKAFDDLVDEIRANVPTSYMVDCAFLQFISPTLQEAVRGAVDQSITHLHILPVFLFPGQHVKVDIPQAIDSVRHAYPELHVEVAPPIGEHPSFRHLVVTRTLAMINAAT